MIEILNEGLAAMLIGMGTVFTFLCLMIIAMNVMSAAVKKLNTIFPEPIPAAAGKQKSVSAGDDSEVAAAIVAAMFSKK